MRILQVTPYFPPSWEAGGVAKVCYEISKRLVENGHEVTVYTTNRCIQDTGVETNRAVDLNGIRVYYFDNLRRILRTPSIPPIPYYMPLIAMRQMNDFDVVHIHDFRTFFSAFAHSYANRFDVPYILQPHASLPRTGRARYFKELFDLLWGNRILRDASMVVAISKEELEQIRQRGIDDKKMELIYSGVDTRPFKEIPRFGRFRRKHSIPCDGKVILYLGRITESKGIDFAIRAFDALSKEMENAYFVISGSDCGYKAELEKLIDSLKLDRKVFVTGPVDEAEKTAAYRDADLFVNAAKYMGGVGITPLEAVLSGTPIIVTEECGEIVRDGEFGVFVKYGDVSDLARKMKTLLQEPELGKAMVERGQKYITNRLSWSSTVARIENVYQRCVDEQS